MSSCCGVHGDKITIDWDVDGPVVYEEYEQNIIFMNIKRTLLIIDSTNYIGRCPQCSNHRRLYIHGTWPDVRASFDGVTDLPICATVNGVEFHQVCIEVHNEPSFGKFIFIYTYRKCDDNAIIYYPTGNIERSIAMNYRGVSVDGKPAICCRTIDGKYVIIDSDGKVIDAEVVYHTDFDDDDEVVFEIGNGILYYDEESRCLKYTANPALKTKPAARE